jgi:hypothetical protein
MPAASVPTPAPLFTCDSDRSHDTAIAALSFKLMPMHILTNLLELSDIADGLHRQLLGDSEHRFVESRTSDKAIEMINTILRDSKQPVITDPAMLIDIRRLIHEQMVPDIHDLIFERITPAFEIATRDMLQHSLEHNKILITDWTTRPEQPDTAQLDAHFDTCLSAINTTLSNIREIDCFVEAVKVQETQAATARAAFDYSGLMADDADDNSAVLESALDSASKLTLKRAELLKHKSQLIDDCISHSFQFINQAVPTAHNRAPKTLTISSKATGEPNARVGKIIYQEFMAYMIQFPRVYYLLIPIFHYICETQRTKDTLIRPPVLETIFRISPAGMRTVPTPPDPSHGPSLAPDAQVLVELSVQSKVLAGVLTREQPELLRKLGRGKRKFSCTTGESIVMQPDLNDGLASAICIVFAHAERTSHLKVNIRDQLECCSGLFTQGSILLTIQKLQPKIEECLQMDINIQYDLSVKAIVIVLVERSPMFQTLMDPYVLNVSVAKKQCAVQSLYDLLIEVECIARESKSSDTLPASKSSESTRQLARARMIHDLDAEPEVAAAAADGTPILCQKLGCTKVLSDAQQIRTAKSLANNQKIGTLCDDCYSSTKGQIGTEIKLKDGRTRTVKEPRSTRTKARAAAAASSPAPAPASAPAPTGEPDFSISEDQMAFLQYWNERKSSVNAILPMPPAPAPAPSPGPDQVASRAEIAGMLADFQSQRQRITEDDP